MCLDMCLDTSIDMCTATSRAVPTGCGPSKFCADVDPSASTDSGAGDAGCGLSWLVVMGGWLLLLLVVVGGGVGVGVVTGLALSHSWG